MKIYYFIICISYCVGILPRDGDAVSQNLYVDCSQYANCKDIELTKDDIKETKYGNISNFIDSMKKIGVFEYTSEPNLSDPQYIKLMNDIFEDFVDKGVMARKKSEIFAVAIHLVTRGIRIVETISDHRVSNVRRETCYYYHSLNEAKAEDIINAYAIKITYRIL